MQRTHGWMASSCAEMLAVLFADELGREVAVVPAVYARHSSFLMEAINGLCRQRLTPGVIQCCSLAASPGGV